jgi:hypothetical protein
MYSKTSNKRMNNPYGKASSKKWKDEQAKKEGKRLLMPHANQRVNLGLKTCRKCAEAQASYKKGDMI